MKGNFDFESLESGFDFCSIVDEFLNEKQRFVDTWSIDMIMKHGICVWLNNKRSLEIGWNNKLRCLFIGL